MNSKISRAPAADRNFDNNEAAPLVLAAAAGGDYAANRGDSDQNGLDGHTDPDRLGPFYYQAFGEPPARNRGGRRSSNRAPTTLRSFAKSPGWRGSRWNLQYHCCPRAVALLGIKPPPG